MGLRLGSESFSLTPGELRNLERLLAEHDTPTSVRTKARILLEHVQGRSLSAIAEEHGVSTQAIWKLVVGFRRKGRLRYLTQRVGRPPLGMEGIVLSAKLSTREAGKFAGISPNTISRARRDLEALRNGHDPLRTNITTVEFDTKTEDIITVIHGSGFGEFPQALPWRGTSHFLRIGNSAQLGFGEYGYAGDYWRLRHEKWTDSEIHVSGVHGQPGDAVVIALWNPQTRAGTAWAGNLPGNAKGPVIERVRFLPAGDNCGLEVSGHGFGPSPFEVPTDRTNYFAFNDWRVRGSRSSCFDAGFGGFGVNDPSIWTLRYKSWSDQRIVITALADPNGMDLDFSLINLQDPVSIVLWNSLSANPEGPQTSWAGRFTLSDSKPRIGE